MDREALSAIDSTEAGSLGVPHLRRLWARVQLGLLGGDPSPTMGELLLDRIVCDSLGMGLTDAMQFLFQPGLSYEGFESWIASIHGGEVPRARIEQTRHRLNVALSDPPPPEWGADPGDDDQTMLSAADLDCFERHGYVVVRGAVSAAGSGAAERAVWEALGASPEDPDSWYSAGRELRRKVMVELYRHPALEANRLAPGVRRAFAQLWETDLLCASTDRVGFSPPERHDYAFPGPGLHFDLHFRAPMPFGLQGILYLTETPAEQGAFQCVPGFHRRMDAWLASLPEGADPNAQDLDSLRPHPIAGGAGDLIIWHHCLPHGPTPNRGALPRIVQYVNMYPYHREVGRRR